MRKLFVVTLLLSSSALLRADFTYTETTQMTGGTFATMMRSMGPLAGRAREPMVSTHMVKGNRQVTITRNDISIVDLDKETITNIDTEKKQYSVMTFAEMKKRMEEAMQKMQKGDARANFKVSAKATGNTKTVQGLSAKEVVITMTTEFTDTKSGQSGAMDMVSDTWVAPVPGYQELQEFGKKMAVKLGAMFGSGMQQIAQMNMGQANMSQAMEELAKEMQKLEGVPVETVMKMGPAGTMAASSAAPQPAQSDSSACAPGSPSPQTQGSQSAAGALAGALGGRLGGFGGLGRRKKEEPPPAAQPAAGCDASAPAAGASGTLMEMTVSMTSFSSTADASKFEVPAGFKQVEARGR